MTQSRGRKIRCAVFAVVAATAMTAAAQTFQKLASFDGSNGALPYYMSLVQGTNGKLYGTTFDGGASCVSGEGCGTVFEITPRAKLTTLYKFFCQPSDCTDGQFLYSGLTLATDGNFYGVTESGGLWRCAFGCGTVFKITPRGKLTTLYKFCQLSNCTDGSSPSAPLVEAADGNFYGTTEGGGTGGGGTIFKINTNRKLSTLYNFCGSCSPGVGALVQGQDGSFYGTADDINGYGIIFKITPKGKLTTLYAFCSQPKCTGATFSQSTLLLASDGNLYGTTPVGGADNCGLYLGGGCGTVFKLTPSGKFTTLYTFCVQRSCADGATPWAGLIQATDGTLYGTTSEGGNSGSPKCEAQVIGCGTVFKITTTGSLTTLYRFDSPTDGWQPTGGLLQATNGDFYGTTEYGGNAGGYGTVFSLSTGLKPFAAFVRSYGKVGQAAGILGQGFIGTTSVLFDGIPAKFVVVYDTFIKATVPRGATNGYVTVSTPRGTLKSNVRFHIIR
jgi:uncharacterized repeat protein (TIGR03803 family)